MTRPTTTYDDLIAHLDSSDASLAQIAALELLARTGAELRRGDDPGGRLAALRGRDALLRDALALWRPDGVMLALDQLEAARDDVLHATAADDDDAHEEALAELGDAAARVVQARERIEAMREALAELRRSVQVGDLPAAELARADAECAEVDARGSRLARLLIAANGFRRARLASVPEGAAPAWWWARAQCPPDVLGGDAWSASARAHAKVCDACAEDLRRIELLDEMAAEADAPSPRTAVSPAFERLFRAVAGAAANLQAAIARLVASGVSLGASQAANPRVSGTVGGTDARGRLLCPGNAIGPGTVFTLEVEDQPASLEGREVRLLFADELLAAGVFSDPDIAHLKLADNVADALRSEASGTPLTAELARAMRFEVRE